jgi:hypothetical protein
VKLNRTPPEREPLDDGARDADRQVPCRDRLEDRLRVAGRVRLGQGVGREPGAPRAALRLRHPDGDRITATTSFDRADLGIRAPRLLIGRRIDVRIDAVLAPEPA